MEDARYRDGGLSAGMDVGARKPSQLDHVRENTERAANRAAYLKERLTDLFERLEGPMPRSAKNQASDVINAAGFVAGTNTALDRIHVELTEMEDLLTRLNDLV